MSDMTPEQIAEAMHQAAMPRVINFMTDVMNKTVKAGTGKVMLQVLTETLDDIAKAAVGQGFTQDQAVIAVSMMLIDMGVSQMKLTQSFMQQTFLALTGIRPTQPGNRFVIVPEGMGNGQSDTADAETQTADIDSGSTESGEDRSPSESN